MERQTRSKKRKRIDTEEASSSAPHQGQQDVPPPVSQQKQQLVDVQQNCPIFRKCPPEVRNMIYGFLLESSRLTYGKRVIAEDLAFRMRPSRNTLAFLKTCRRANQEIGDSWIGKVLFNFEDTITMLDKLTVVPTQTLSKIRHLRVRGESLPLRRTDPANWHRLLHILDFLPGLQLDTLTVLGVCGEERSWDTVNGLVNGSSGWKELRFLSPSSKLLGLSLQQGRIRRPHPEEWQNLLLRRDGESTQPSVAIYRSANDADYCSLLKEDARVSFALEAPVFQAGTSQPSRPTVGGYRLTTFGQRINETLIVVKRGEGVDYRLKQKYGKRNDGGGLRTTPNRAAWLALRESRVWARPINSMYAHDDTFGCESDSDCDDVDSYDWTPLNFGLGQRPQDLARARSDEAEGGDSESDYDPEDEQEGKQVLGARCFKRYSFP